MFEEHCRCPGCGTCNAHSELEGIKIKLAKAEAAHMKTMYGTEKLLEKLELLEKIVEAADEMRLDYLETGSIDDPIPESVVEYDKKCEEWRKHSG
jgi:hypothetical protein